MVISESINEKGQIKESMLTALESEVIYYISKKLRYNFSSIFSFRNNNIIGGTFFLEENGLLSKIYSFFIKNKSLYISEINKSGRKISTEKHDISHLM